MTHRRRLPAECGPVLRALVGPLRYQMEEQGLSQARLGIRLGCDRSRVSRALSGREVPPLHLIEQIAEAVGADVAQSRRRWIHADAIRWKARACEAGGGPPDGLYAYADFLGALRDLMRGRGVTQRELIRRDHRLRRSTVGAVLRGERAATRGMVIAIVRACGVSNAVLGHRLVASRPAAPGGAAAAQVGGLPVQDQEGCAMDVTGRSHRGHPPCVVEVRVRGLLYVRIERFPRWLVPAVVAAFPVIGTWLPTR